VNCRRLELRKSSAAALDINLTSEKLNGFLGKRNDRQ
jgi:hypothetical protein